MYLKELERQKLQDILHKDVMLKIIFLQRWFRAQIQRREFIRMREAAILIQVYHNWFCVWAVFLPFCLIDLIDFAALLAQLPQREVLPSSGSDPVSMAMFQTES